MPTHAYAAVTIASKNYIALARVTAKSFQQHNPGIPFFLLLTDTVDGYITPADEPFEILTLDQLAIPRQQAFRFQYAQQELSYAATPYILHHLLSSGYERVVFLKQETFVLDEISPSFELLKQYSLLLTPHFLDPPDRSGALRCELDVLRAGVFNGGFIGVSAQPDAMRFLEWWMQRTARNCFCAVEQGLHYEQRWLDFAPGLVERVHIVRDPGMNIGHWNLNERQLQVRDGHVTAQGVPCRIFRLSGFEPEHPEFVTKYNRHQTVSGAGEAAQVIEEYLSQLVEKGYAETRSWPYAYATFDNGAAIPPEARRVYHDLGDAAERFGNPFKVSGDESFFSWFGARGRDSGEQLRTA